MYIRITWGSRPPAVSLGQQLSFCISNVLPADADAGVPEPGPHLEEQGFKRPLDCDIKRLCFLKEI